MTPSDEMRSLIQEMRTMQERINRLKETNDPRSLNVACTKLDEAELWLMRSNWPATVRLLERPFTET